jgi:MOSC domain-containing protein YiiM
VVTGKGLVGNANQGGKRQITLLGADSWAMAVKELGAELDPSIRRANLLVSGVQMVECRGRTLQIGNLRIRIHGETRPCELMDRQQPGLRSVLSEDWRGGVFGEALDTGSIAVGDSVRWLD